MLICLSTENESSFAGEVDGSYFGGHRKGKRSRGAAGKVYTKVIADTKAKTMMGIMQKN
jgi:hypothetical protein